MVLEDFFDFSQGPLDIRLKETRVGIETVLRAYLEEHKSAEEIAATYPSLTLAMVYATILYYLANQEQVRQYLAELDEDYRRRVEEFDRNPPPGVLRLKKLMDRINSYPPEQRDEARERIIAEESARIQAIEGKQRAEVP